MINPCVFNADRSEEFVAVVVDEVVSAGLSDVQKSLKEGAIKESGRGSQIDCRYFLKEGVTIKARSLSGITKSKLHKRRCHTINVHDLNKKTLLDFRQGIQSDFMIAWKM